MASIIYNEAKEKMGTGGFNPVGQTVHMLLLDATSTTPDNQDHRFIADISADEVVDGSYSRHVVGSKTGTKNTSADRWEFSFANPVFTSLANGGVSVKFAVWAIIVTNDADSWLAGCHDIADTVPDGTDFELVVGSSGALHIT